MNRALVLVAILAACGDNHEAELSPDATVYPDAFQALCDDANPAAGLRKLPNVTKVDEKSCGPYVLAPAKCFHVQFQQPVQHDAPDAAHFVQHLYTIHRGCDKPTLVGDWGYDNDFAWDDELSSMFKSNVVWIEHRFQGASTPATADWDWTALTIDNGAADVHSIIESYHRYYDGRFVTTGASKGGVTAVYHAYRYPHDIDGSIPYVAPASRARVDPEYQTYQTTHLPPVCAQQVRDMQVAALTTRRTMMLAHFAHIVPGAEALYLDYLTSFYDWAFWQYFGVTNCAGMPTAASTDQEFWDFYATISQLDQWVGTAARPSPANSPESDGALEYEWLTEQGYALQINATVEALIQDPGAKSSMAERFAESFPEVTLPDYDGHVTAEARAWVRDDARHVMLIYGQYDPWSGGNIDEPKQPSSARFFVPNATHGAQMIKLDPAERTQALAIASSFFGTEAMPPPPRFKRHEGPNEIVRFFSRFDRRVTALAKSRR